MSSSAFFCQTSQGHFLAEHSVGVSMALFVLLATILAMSGGENIIAMSGGENSTVEVSKSLGNLTWEHWYPCFKTSELEDEKTTSCLCQHGDFRANWTCFHRFAVCVLPNFSFATSTYLPCPKDHHHHWECDDGEPIVSCKHKFNRQRRTRRRVR